MSMSAHFECDICGMKVESIGDAVAKLHGIKFTGNKPGQFEFGQVMESGKHVCDACLRRFFTEHKP